MKNYFEDFLKEKHAKNYMGTDDDMPDDFERWVGELDTQKILDFGDEAIRRNRIEAMENILDSFAPHIRGLREMLSKIESHNENNTTYEDHLEEFLKKLTK